MSPYPWPLVRHSQREPPFAIRTNHSPPCTRVPTWLFTYTHMVRIQKCACRKGPSSHLTPAQQHRHQYTFYVPGNKWMAVVHPAHIHPRECKKCFPSALPLFPSVSMFQKYSSSFLVHTERPQTKHKELVVPSLSASRTTFHHIVDQSIEPSTRQRFAVWLLVLILLSGVFVHSCRPQYYLPPSCLPVWSRGATHLFISSPIPPSHPLPTTGPAGISTR